MVDYPPKRGWKGKKRSATTFQTIQANTVELLEHSIHTFIFEVIHPFLHTYRYFHYNGKLGT